MVCNQDRRLAILRVPKCCFIGSCFFRAQIALRALVSSRTFIYESSKTVHKALTRGLDTFTNTARLFLVTRWEDFHDDCGVNYYYPISSHNPWQHHRRFSVRSRSSVPRLPWLRRETLSILWFEACSPTAFWLATGGFIYFTYQRAGSLQIIGAIPLVQIAFQRRRPISVVQIWDARRCRWSYVRTRSL